MNISAAILTGLKITIPHQMNCITFMLIYAQIPILKHIRV